MSKKTNSKNFRLDRPDLKTDILTEAKAIGAPLGFIEAIVDRVVSSVQAQIAAPAAPSADPVLAASTPSSDSASASPSPAVLNALTAAELEKYHPDLAFVFRNRGRII